MEQYYSPLLPFSITITLIKMQICFYVKRIKELYLPHLQVICTHVSKVSPIQKIYLTADI